MDKSCKSATLLEITVWNYLFFQLLPLILNYLWRRDHVLFMHHLSLCEELSKGSLIKIMSEYNFD